MFTKRIIARPGVRSLIPAAFLAGAFAIASLPSQASAQATGAVTTFHNFSAADGTGATFGLLKASDGNFYGTTDSGGNSGKGTVYKVTPDGTFSVLHSFVNDSTTNVLEGSSPTVLIQGADGNLYGLCGGGGVNPVTVAGGGTFYRLGLDGTFTKLYDFDTGTANSDVFPVALVQGGDGNFYGLTRVGGASGVNEGTYFRLSPDGKTFTELFAFKGSNNGLGYAPAAQLLVGKDGNFYGTTTTSGGDGSGTSGSGTIFKATTSGAITMLYPFVKNTDPSGVTAPLIQGTDGAFYGVSTTGGSVQFGNIFRYGPDGSFSILHEFTDPQVDGVEPRGALVQGSDGNFYGSVNTGFAADPASLMLGPGGYFQITSSGNYTLLSKLATTGTGPFGPFGSLVEYKPGVFLGVTAGGPGGNGVLAQLTVTGSSLPSSFFTGQTALANGVYYLQFASGNPFGYYSFLSDPHYIFHQDLGFRVHL